MLAGRKLLLADDSLTIQKVVELTFSHEGAEVVSVSDGQEAIERIEDVRPDIVLADVFMPGKSGYEVCEYIKQNAKLRHIPVMLLVGSFEPFDEAEARRVGADDILTKPFQSIRRLMDKVGGLVSSKPALPEDPIAKADEPVAELPKVEEPTAGFLEDKVPTAELPKAEEPVAVKTLSTDELEVTTADTRPLPMGESFANYAAALPADLPKPRQDVTPETWENRNMESTASESQNDSYQETGGTLLDLGDGGPTFIASSEEFVLDIDLDEVFEAPAVASTSFAAPAFAEPQYSQAAVGGWEVQKEESRIAPAQSVRSESAYRNEFAESGVATPASPAVVSAHENQEWMHEEAKPSSHVVSHEAQAGVMAAQPERVLDEPGEVMGTVMPGGPITLERLSPEVIDAIARRTVALLSEKVVQEIAWEVVPQLAELLIKRKLEEKESQPN